MRTPIVVVVALSWSLVCVSCTCASDDQPGPARAPRSMPSLLDRAPAPLPEGWIFEAEVGGDAVLAAIGERIPEGGLALPTRIGDLLDAWIPVPTAIVDRIASGSPLRCVTLPRGDEGVDAVCAVRVDDLPPGTEIAPGGPRGAGWIASDRGALAVADHVLVAARERALVERALPYLAPTLLAEEHPERRVRVRVAPDIAARALRTIADEAIGSYVRDARDRIATERAAHDTPPALGEPEALVGALASWASGLTSYLPDLGAIELTLTPSETGLALRARGEVREGSPLARTLASVPDAGALGLDVIPASAVVAWSTRSGEAARAALASEVVGPLAEVAGPRIDEGARGAIEAAVGEWASARGPTSIGALGAGARSLYALLVTDCARPLAASRITPALETEWSRTVLEAPLGCGERPCAALDAAEREGACALVVLGAAEASAEGGVAAGALARTQPLVASPEVARELAEAPPDAIARLIVLPERAPALLARVLGAAREGEDAGSRAPLVLSIAREPGALLIDLRGPSAAIGALLRVIAPS